jgi:hypothetical protein
MKAASLNFCQVLPSGESSQMPCLHPSHAASLPISGCYWFAEDGAICRSLPHIARHQVATLPAGYCNLPSALIFDEGHDLALVQPPSCGVDSNERNDDVTYPCRCHDNDSVTTSPLHDNRQDTRTMPTTLV